MNYENVKKRLGGIIGDSVFLKKAFFQLINILLLRTWYIHKELKAFRKKNQNTENISVLDAGSGFGQYSYYIANKNPNWKIESVDINEYEIKKCQEFFKKSGLKNISCKTADLTNFKNKSSYDLIMSVDVIEHIEEDEVVFANFYKSLKENGVLLISTPSDMGGSDVQDDNQNSFIDEHVRDGYSIKDLSAKLTNAGFKHVDVYYTYGKYGNISWRLSIKYPLLMGKHRMMLPLLFLFYLIVMPFCLVLNYIDTIINNKTGTGLIVKAYK